MGGKGLILDISAKIWLKALGSSPATEVRPKRKWSTQLNSKTSETHNPFGGQTRQVVAFRRPVWSKSRWDRHWATRAACFAVCMASNVVQCGSGEDRQRHRAGGATQKQETERSLVCVDLGI